MQYFSHSADLIPSYSIDFVIERLLNVVFSLPFLYYKKIQLISQITVTASAGILVSCLLPFKYIFNSTGTRAVFLEASLPCVTSVSNSERLPGLSVCWLSSQLADWLLLSSLSHSLAPRRWSLLSFPKFSDWSNLWPFPATLFLSPEMLLPGFQSCFVHTDCLIASQSSDTTQGLVNCGM